MTVLPPTLNFKLITPHDEWSDREIRVKTVALHRACNPEQMLCFFF